MNDTIMQGQWLMERARDKRLFGWPFRTCHRCGQRFGFEFVDDKVMVHTSCQYCTPDSAAYRGDWQYVAYTYNNMVGLARQAAEFFWGGYTEPQASEEVRIGPVQDSGAVVSLTPDVKEWLDQTTRLLEDIDSKLSGISEKLSPRNRD